MHTLQGIYHWSRHPLHALLLRLAATALVFTGLYLQLATVDFPTDWALPALKPGLGVVLLLVATAVNYSLESLKWQTAFQGLEHAAPSFSVAYRAVLTGQALGIFTPNRSGDFLGRILHLPKSTYRTALAATGLARWAQLLATLLGGAVGFLVLGLATPGVPAPSTTLLKVALPAGVFLFACFALLLFYAKPTLQFLHRLLSGLGLYRRMNLPMERVQARKLLQLSALAMLRYVVFLLQLGLLFALLGYPLAAAELVVFTGLLFFLKSMVPSFTLAELGVRESVALWVGSFLLLPPGVVLSVSLGLFCFNLLLPSLLGSVLLWRKPRR